METFSLFVLLLFLCYVIYDDVWERRYKWDTTKQRASDAFHLNEKNNGGENRKLEKEKERIKKKERRTHPSSLSSPGGSFRFRFNDVLFFVRVTPIIMFSFLLLLLLLLLLLFYIILWSVVSSITNKTDWKMKKQKKKVLPARCLFLNHHHHHST